MFKFINMDLFNKEGHLSKKGISIYLDSLFCVRREKLNFQMLEHVRKCSKCKKDIIKIYNILKKSENPDYDKKKCLDNLDNNTKIVPLYYKSTIIKRRNVFSNVK